jgi:hypothetical protein
MVTQTDIIIISIIIHDQSAIIHLLFHQEQVSALHYTHTYVVVRRITANPPLT